jgi:tripeptidyl-peptidase-1
MLLLNQNCFCHENFVIIEKADNVNVMSKPELKKLEKSHPDHMHSIVIVCKRKNIDKLKRIVDDISNPSSVQFGKYMNKNEIQDLTYKPQSIQFVKDFLKNSGIDIDMSESRSHLVRATAAISQWEEIFNNKFYEFEITNRMNNARMKLHRALDYSLDTSLVEHVEFIHNLIHFPSTIKSKPPTPIKKSLYKDSSAIDPPLLFSYYSINSQTGNNLGNQSFFGSLSQKYNPNDLQKFQETFNLNVQSIAGSIDGSTVSTTDCNTATNNCLEANLDSQYLMAVSQVTPTYYDYYGDTNSFVDWALWISTIEALDKPPLVISISYGSGEPGNSSFAQFDASALALSARGVTLVGSSGDDGAHYTGVCEYSPSFPATSQYVTTVGATMGPESGSTEIVCACDAGSSITSGGGFSDVEPLPSWQASFVSTYFSTVATQPASGYSITGRGYPDVSLAGNNYLVIVNGDSYLVSGTSASAPVFAGMVALVNAARLANGQSTLGWMNPSLYKNFDSIVLNDVTSGNNLCGRQNFFVCDCCSVGFHASSGWDPVTGLGSVNFEKFYNTFVTGTSLN